MSSYDIDQQYIFKTIPIAANNALLYHNSLFFRKIKYLKNSPSNLFKIILELNINQTDGRL